MTAKKYCGHYSYVTPILTNNESYVTGMLRPIPKGEPGKSRYAMRIHYVTWGFEKVEYR
jgi:hypothetical protein